jgi:neutral ceramidase
MALNIGFGRGTVTPDVPVALAGFGARTEPAHSVHDELEVRAVVFDDGKERLCLLVYDLLGMSRDASSAIRDAVAADLGVDLAQVLPACIHTHSGPSAITGSEALGWVIPPDYTDALVSAGREAARGAAAAAEPASLHFARAPLPEGLSINRRGLPYDPWFTAVSARRPDGSVIGTIANLGVHPVSLGHTWLQVSADYVGPFRTALEAGTGGDAVLLQSGLGDVNPAPERWANPDAPDFGPTAALGQDVAAAVASLLRTAVALAADSLGATSRWITVPVGNTPLAALVGGAGTAMDVELVEWQIGELSVVAVPGEPFHKLVNQIDESRQGPVLIAALAPVWQGYLPVPWGEGYEETVSYGQEAVEAMARALVAGG